MNIQSQKTLVFFIVIGLSLMAITSIFFPETEGKFTYEVNTFSSYDELRLFLANVTNQSSHPYYMISMDGSKSGSSRKLSVPESITSSDSSNTGSTDFSETNIQVAGVDEPDIVKTDGTYLYVVANNKVYILKAYPASDTSLLSTISFNETHYVTGLFINKDSLIIFSSLNTISTFYEEKTIHEPYYVPSYPKTVITRYDISDRDNPIIKKTIEIDGSFFDARMIDDTIYIVSIEYAYQMYPYINGNQTLRIPELSIDNETTPIDAQSIYYVDVPEKADTMTHVLRFDLNDETVIQKSFLLGSSQSMYVSKNAIYLASNHYNYQPGILSRGSTAESSTIIHKILINEDIKYIAQGEVPGTILNQFSMDEHNGFFRIATTIGTVWNQETPSSNNIYVLNNTLATVSSIENIAPGERIYSARFLGERAYLVTFKKIDPFFTIDLSDPFNPEILGKLKIPGYSDYLHPFDENHIIGIGKETVEALTEQKESRNLDFAWYQGVKMAIFNVTDVKNPTELSKEIIGDRGTSSPALYDHKAFLFDKEKELLVIPVSLYEIPEDIKQQHDNYTDSTYGEFTFQGAYVYRVTLTDGFELLGRISHLSNESMKKTGFYPEWTSSITRTLYIGNALYTISESMIGVHQLDTLEEITMISLD